MRGKTERVERTIYKHVYRLHYKIELGLKKMVQSLQHNAHRNERLCYVGMRTLCEVSSALRKVTQLQSLDLLLEHGHSGQVIKG